MQNKQGFPIFLFSESYGDREKTFQVRNYEIAAVLWARVFRHTYILVNISSKFQNIRHDVGHIGNVENVRKDRMLLASQVISKEILVILSCTGTCVLLVRVVCAHDMFSVTDRINIGGHEIIQRPASNQLQAKPLDHFSA